jgi:glycine cleavage system H protein
MLEQDNPTLRYSDEHLWFRREDSHVTIGVTEKIARILTIVSLVELPAPGAQLAAGDELAVIESQKATIWVAAPLPLQIVAVNDEVTNDPMLVRTESYGSGWLIQARLEDDGWEALLDATAYAAVTTEIRERR